MKVNTLLILLIILFAYSCKKEYIEPLNDISACGKEDPLNQLSWLNSKVRNGKDPSNTDFIEHVWIKEYKGEDIIIIEFGLTSTVYDPFNCSGVGVKIHDINFYNTLSDNDLVYRYNYNDL